MGAHAGTQSQTLGRALETLEKKEVLLESEGLRTQQEHGPLSDSFSMRVKFVETCLQHIYLLVVEIGKGNLASG